MDMHKHHRWALVILRVGLAFAFLFPAISAVFNPYDWIGYFPSFLKGYVPDMVLLHAFGATEVIIALWLLWGKRIFIPSLAAALYLAAIVALDYRDFEILFRDLSIMSIAIALMCFSCTCAECRGVTQNNGVA